MAERALVTFVETSPFRSSWETLGLTLDDLFALQDMLIANPTLGAVVRGTGGLRKMRFAPPGAGRGKRGGCRVGYAIFPTAGRIALLAVYQKSAKADFTPRERTAIKAMIEFMRKSWEASP